MRDDALFGEQKRSASIASHERSLAAGSDEWITPKWIIDTLGPFDLDPCAAVIMPWPTATVSYTENENGLSRAWHGLVWLNPPYGRATSKWLERMADHNNGIALIFARTETDMFFRNVWLCASALLFLRRRVHFHKRDGSLPSALGKGGSGGPGAPSVLVGFGDDARQRLFRMASKGALVTGWVAPSGAAATNEQVAPALL